MPDWNTDFLTLKKKKNKELACQEKKQQEDNKIDFFWLV